MELNYKGVVSSDRCHLSLHLTCLLHKPEDETGFLRRDFTLFNVFAFDVKHYQEDLRITNLTASRHVRAKQASSD